MALVREITCTVCGDPSIETCASGCRLPDICRDCRHKQAKIKRQAHFKQLDLMSLELRIRRIEEILYDEPWRHTHPELMRF